MSTIYKVSQLSSSPIVRFAIFAGLYSPRSFIEEKVVPGSR